MFSFKKMTVALVSAFILAGVSTNAMAQDVKKVDGTKTLAFSEATDKSEIKFVSEAPQEKIVGTASKIKGKVAINFDDLKDTKGKIQFPVATMKTGNDTRDDHLRSADWLNAEANPNITFEIKSLKGVELKSDDDKKAVFTGTALGAVTVNGKAATSQAKVRVSVLKGKGKVKVEFNELNVTLSEHDVAGTKGTVGAKVGKTIAVSGTLYGKVD